MPTPVLRPLYATYAEVNLGALRHNVRVLQAQAGAVPLMGVVKADAYGHGAVAVVQALQQEGVRHFCVATVPEALHLRTAGLADPILVFGAPLPEWLPAYVAHDLDVTVSSRAVAEAVQAVARTTGPLRVQVKIDTGMGRIGVPPEDAVAVVRMLEQAPGVTVAGLWTHFATADEPGHPFTREQWRRFEQVWQALAGAAPPYRHAANSAALYTLPESACGLVRAGIALYGLSEVPMPTPLRPVMRLVSRVTHCKAVEAGTSISYNRTWCASHRTRIATIGAGYADGYRRLLSNRAWVGIGGQPFPVVGTVCMDMLMVDLGEPGGSGEAVQVGDEAVLLGEGGPSAFELARWAETIPYEITTAISIRVPRHLLDLP